jgi:hypothetical protein
MSILTSFLRTAAPAFGLFAVLAIASPCLTAAEGDPVVKAEATMESCPVCNKNMKDMTDKKAMSIDGRSMHCCGDKCAAEIMANKEYYKGYHDGRRGVNQTHIGPKGGDTRKGVPTGN